MFLFASAVNLFSMTNRYDPYRKFIVLYRVNNAVSSLAQSVPFLSGQFFAAWWARVALEGLYALKDSFYIILRDAGKILFHGFPEQYAIFGHLF